MTIQWNENELGVGQSTERKPGVGVGVPAPRENIQIVQGAQVVEPMTAGFVVNKLANMGWEFLADSSTDPDNIPKGVAVFQTTPDIPASNPVRGQEARTALDLLHVMALSAGGTGTPQDGELPPGSLVGVELAPALGAEPDVASFTFFAANGSFDITEEQLNDAIGDGGAFALLGTNVNEAPLFLPLPLASPPGPGPMPPGPPGPPPSPTTEEKPKKKSNAILVGAGAGAALGGVAGGVPGIIIGLIGGALLGRAMT